MEKLDKGFLQDHCDIVIIRGSIGFGDIIALTALFRELKRLNPFIRTTLKTCKDKVADALILMQGQPYLDRIVSVDEDVKRDIPYYEIDLSATNYEYEQKHKPNVSKSRARVNLDALEIYGDSKPIYLLQEEDIEWCEKLSIPRWYSFVQMAGKEKYKSCDMEQLLVYCRAIAKIHVLGDIVIVSSQVGDSVEKIEDHIYVVKCINVRRAIALMARSMVCVGFDSVFLHASAALDTPFLGLLGPTSCQGRISDHRHGDIIRSGDCESCLRCSTSACKITDSHDKSACLYNINTVDLVRKLEALRDRKGAVVGSVMSYSPGEYYEIEGDRRFDPQTQKFNVDDSNISKIHQPVHNDGSYEDEWQAKRVKWLCDNAITEEGVLDVGCSNGFIVDNMRAPKKGYRHCGIDIDGDRIRRAKNTKKKNIDFYVIDARHGLPFPDKSFSTVILAEMLEHLPFDVAKEMLKEACRIAKGKVLLTMPFAGDDYKEDPDRIRMVESTDHLWFVTVDNLEKLLEGYEYKSDLGYFAFIDISGKKKGKQEKKVAETKIGDKKRETPLSTGRISVTLITRNRPEHLMGCLSSLLSQSFKEWDLVLIDDSEPSLKDNRPVSFLIKVAQDEGHDIQLICGEKLGISQAWQRGLELSKCEFGQRLEDDVWLHPDYLKHLHSVIVTDEKIGAVGGLAPNAWHFDIIDGDKFKNYFYMNNGLVIPDDSQCKFIRNPQELYEVVHLHGLFLYRSQVIKDVGGFNVRMERIAHRDETDLTLRMYFADYKLLVCPKAWLRHAEDPKGGSRDKLTVEERTKLQGMDEVKFQTRLQEWRKTHPNKPFPIQGAA